MYLLRKNCTNKQYGYNKILSRTARLEKVALTAAIKLQCTQKCTIMAMHISSKINENRYKSTCNFAEIFGIRTSRLVFTARLRPQFRMPPSFDRCTPPRRRFNQNMPPSVVLLQQFHCRNRHGQTSKSISSVSFVRIESNFFYNTQETQTQKNDGPEF